MSDCSSHPKEIAGITDMKQLAQMIRNLHHETRAILIDELAKEISLEGLEDDATKPKLAEQHFMTAGYLTKAAIHASWAAQISKPFMKQK